MERKIKIALVDDHYLMREGIISLLKEYPVFEIMLEAANGREFLNSLNSENYPDLVVLDLDMPILDGIKTTELLRKDHPAIKILILTMHDDVALISELSQKGANGYLLKNNTSEYLAEAICSIMNNENYFINPESRCTNVESNLRSNFKQSSLTEREVEIISLLCQELSNKEIGELLCIGVRTVETHRENIMKKVGAKNFAGIITFGVINNLHLKPVKKKATN